MEIKFDPRKILVVDIDNVKPNNYNPKDKQTEDYETIKQGIKIKGLRLPIIVRELNKKYAYEIIDGEQRWTACKELGFKQVIVYNEGVVSDQEAKELTLWYEQHVPFNEVQLAKLITEMEQMYKDLKVPYAPEEIQEMKELINFNWEDFQKTENEDEEDNEMRTLMLTMSKAQYDVIMQAVDKAKIAGENPDMAIQTALELICGDYLAGA